MRDKSANDDDDERREKEIEQVVTANSRSQTVNTTKSNGNRIFLTRQHDRGEKFNHNAISRKKMCSMSSLHRVSIDKRARSASFVFPLAYYEIANTLDCPSPEHFEFLQSITRDEKRTVLSLPVMFAER